MDVRKYDVYTRCDLKQKLHFTDDLIHELLPTPYVYRNVFDKLCCIWHGNDVRAAMETEQYRKRLEQYNRRGEKAKEAAKKASTTRREKTHNYIRSIADTMEIPILDREEITREAFEKANHHYWNREKQQDEYYEDFSQADEEIQKRIIAAYIVNYRIEGFDDRANEIFQNTRRMFDGGYRSKNVFRNMLLKRVYKVYPYLEPKKPPENR